jgi:Flp pilus assembly protein TadB
MEIVIVWSWFSFIVGAVSAVFAAFFLALVFSFKQWKKQKEAAKEQTDSVERMFAAWGGRDNSSL